MSACGLTVSAQGADVSQCTVGVEHHRSEQLAEAERLSLVRLLLENRGRLHTGTLSSLLYAEFGNGQISTGKDHFAGRYGNWCGFTQEPTVNLLISQEEDRIVSLKMEVQALVETLKTGSKSLSATAASVYGLLGGHVVGKKIITDSHRSFRTFLRRSGLVDIDEADSVALKPLLTERKQKANSKTPAEAAKQQIAEDSESLTIKVLVQSAGERVIGHSSDDGDSKLSSDCSGAHVVMGGMRAPFMRRVVRRVKNEAAGNGTLSGVIDEAPSSHVPHADNVHEAGQKQANTLDQLQKLRVAKRQWEKTYKEIDGAVAEGLLTVDEGARWKERADSELKAAVVLEGCGGDANPRALVSISGASDSSVQADSVDRKQHLELGSNLAVTDGRVEERQRCKDVRERDRDRVRDLVVSRVSEKGPRHVASAKAHDFAALATSGEGVFVRDHKDRVIEARAHARGADSKSRSPHWDKDSQGAMGTHGSRGSRGRGKRDGDRSRDRSRDRNRDRRDGYGSRERLPREWSRGRAGDASSPSPVQGGGPRDCPHDRPGDRSRDRPSSGDSGTTAGKWARGTPPNSGAAVRTGREVGLEGEGKWGRGGGEDARSRAWSRGRSRSWSRGRDGGGGVVGARMREAGEKRAGERKERRERSAEGFQGQTQRSVDAVQSDVVHHPPTASQSKPEDALEIKSASQDLFPRTDRAEHVRKTAEARGAEAEEASGEGAGALTTDQKRLYQKVSVMLRSGKEQHGVFFEGGRACMYATKVVDLARALNKQHFTISMVEDLCLQRPSTMSSYTPDRLRFSFGYHRPSYVVLEPSVASSSGSLNAVAKCARMIENRIVAKCVASAATADSTHASTSTRSQPLPAAVRMHDNTVSAGASTCPARMPQRPPSLKYLSFPPPAATSEESTEHSKGHNSSIQHKTSMQHSTFPCGAGPHSSICPTPPQPHSMCSTPPTPASRDPGGYDSRGRDCKEESETGCRQRSDRPDAAAGTGAKTEVLQRSNESDCGRGTEVVAAGKRKRETVAGTRTEMLLGCAIWTMPVGFKVSDAEFPLLWEGSLMWLGGRAAVRLLHVDGDDIRVMLHVENTLSRQSEWEVLSRELSDVRPRGGATGRSGSGVLGESTSENCKRAFAASKMIICAVVSAKGGEQWWLDTSFASLHRPRADGRESGQRRSVGQEMGEEGWTFPINLPVEGSLCGVVVSHRSSLHRHLIRGRVEPILVFFRC